MMVSKSHCDRKGELDREVLVCTHLQEKPPSLHGRTQLETEVERLPKLGMFLSKTKQNKKKKLVARTRAISPNRSLVLEETVFIEALISQSIVKIFNCELSLVDALAEIRAIFSAPGFLLAALSSPSKHGRGLGHASTAMLMVACLWLQRFAHIDTW